MHLEDVLFPSNAVKLAGTLTCSNASPPHEQRAVILAAGSGHHDRDETVCGKTPFKTISDSLAARGFTVLRFDSRGFGASGGSTEDTTFDTKVEDLLAAHTFLTTRGIAPGRVAFVGHSEGGLTAGAAAAKVPAYVAMLAGPAMPIEDLLHRQAWVASSQAGATPAQLAHERQMNARVFAIARETAAHEIRQRLLQEIMEEALRSWPDQVWESERQITDSAATMAAIVSATDYCTLLQQRPERILSEVRAPILAMFGGKDVQVEAEPNLHAFRAATVGNPNATAHVFADHNHLFQVADTGAIEAYEHLGDAPSPAALDYLAAWLTAAMERGDRRSA